MTLFKKEIILMCLASSLAGGFFSAWLSNSAPVEASRTDDEVIHATEVVSRSFRLIDSDGETKAVLVDLEGTPALLFRGTESQILFWDDSETLRAAFRLLSDGSAIEFFDSDENLQVRLSGRPSLSSLKFEDQERNMSLDLGFQVDGAAWFRGRTMARQTRTADPPIEEFTRPTLSINDESHSLTVSSGDMTIHQFDEDQVADPEESAMLTIKADGISVTSFNQDGLSDSRHLRISSDELSIRSADLQKRLSLGFGGEGNPRLRIHDASEDVTAEVGVEPADVASGGAFIRLFPPDRSGLVSLNASKGSFGLTAYSQSSGRLFLGAGADAAPVLNMVRNEKSPQEQRILLSFTERAPFQGFTRGDGFFSQLLGNRLILFDESGDAVWSAP